MKSITEIGEFGLIDILSKDTIYDSSTLAVGIGDDTAAFLSAPGKLQLITTDMLVEMVHFDLNTTTARQLGYKAIAVNLSDIAAMGGVPRQVLISIALPKKTELDFIIDLYKGMKEICREFKVNIIGGDTVSSPEKIVINVTATGEVEPRYLTKRSGAKEGDIAAVTGNLGNSAAGLELLTKGFLKNIDLPDFKFVQLLADAHLTPRPQVGAGQILAAAGATSMNDISDGLASECHEIAAASQIGLELCAAKIPLSPEIIEAAEYLDKGLLEYALYGGEDFQLLFTMPPDIFADLKEQKNIPLFAVGTVKNKEHGVTIIDAAGNKKKIEPKGYNHFRR